MPGKQVTELDALPSFTDNSLLPVHNGAGLKKGLLSQLANYLGKKFSNPNLLINPDFKINQRGATSYTSAVAQTIKVVYSVDRWSLYGHSLTVNSDKSVTITPTTYSDGALIQNLETPVDGDITVQVYAVGVSGTATVSVGPSDGSSTTEIGTLKNGLNTFTFSKGIKRLVIRVKSGTLTLKYAKVEQGTVATTFVAPNYADELIKCQRYYFKRYYYYVFYSGSASFTYMFSDTIPSMRIKPTIDFANTSNSGLTKAVVSLDTTVKDLTLLIQAVTSKVGNCNVGGTIALDAEIY
jgi:hypothetical protein